MTTYPRPVSILEEPPLELDAPGAGQRVAAPIDDQAEADQPLRENRDFLTKVQDQVGASDDLTRMIEGLEERYDSYMAGSTQATPIIHTGDLPSADELGAELERFLASRPSGDDEPRNGLG